MKKQTTLYRSLRTVALVTASILMVPLVAMQFTTEVDWSMADFMIMGALISGTGLAYVFLSRLAPNWIYRIAITLTLGTTFLMLWANMAVGLIGSGPNAGNIMYAGVVFIVMIGSVIARFSAAGMERAMYITTGALVVLMIIAFLMGMHRYPQSSFEDVFGVGSFFAALFFLAGSLFRAAKEPKPV